MRSLCLLPIMVVLYAAPTAAQTVPAPDKVENAFAKVDTNHDGVLSLAEWTAAGRRERGFKMIDADGNGKLTPAELKAAMAKFGRRG